MKTLVVYFSADGNTERAALALAPQLKAELVKLEPVKPYPGFILARFPRCAIEGIFGQPRSYKPLSVQVVDFDRIVIGTPTWMGRMAGPVRKFISDNQFKGKQLGFFASCMHVPQDCIIEAELLITGATVMSRRVFTHADLSGKNGSLDSLCREFADRFEFN